MEKYDLKTLEDVKAELGITKFSEIKKEQIVELVSSLHKIDPEVAKEAIAQIPSYMEASTQILKILQENCTNILEKATTGDAKTINNLEILLEQCSALLQRPDISISESMDVISKEVEINNTIAAIQEKQKHFMYKLNAQYAGVAVAAFAGVVALVGGNLKIDMVPIKNGIAKVVPRLKK